LEVILSRAWIEHNFAFIFPAYFVALWLFVTTLLGFLSGWFALAKAFPDREEVPALSLSYQSGSMGLGVHMRGILSLAVCSSGLRVGIMRLFGPFSRSFFVPWSSLSVIRKRMFFMPAARLKFGGIGSLTISTNTAEKLAFAAGKNWPESGAIPSEKPRKLAGRLLIQWALITSFAAAFFIIAPMDAPKEARPPIIVAILFPAIVFGAVTVVRFFREKN